MTVKAQRPPKPPLKLVKFKDLLKLDLTDRSMVKGLILEETLVLIVGFKGCRKTFLTLDLVLHMVLGRDWFGRRIRKKHRAIYVAAEAGNSINKRIAAFAFDKLGEDYEGDLDFAALTSPVDLCHLDHGDVERLTAAIKEVGGGDVVVIDTVSRAMAGGDENGPEDMGAFVKGCDQLRDQLKCTVIAVHHLGKDASKGSRGHSLLQCSADTVLQIEKHDEVSIATLIHQRDEVSGCQIAFTLKPVELGRDQDDDPVTSCVVQRTDMPTRDDVRGQRRLLLDALIEAVNEHGGLMGNGHGKVTLDQWRDQVKKRGGFENSEQLRSAWNRVRKQLVEDGLVSREGDLVWPTVGA